MQRAQTHFQELSEEEPGTHTTNTTKKWKGKELHAHIKALVTQMEEDDANTFYKEAACYTFSYSILFWYHDSLRFYFYFKHYMSHRL